MSRTKSSENLAIDREQLHERAERLLKARIARWPGGISHREIAERSGLTKGYVTRFVNGNARNPTLLTLSKLATALDCRFQLQLKCRND